jgi:hypothetical protein
MNEKIKVNDMFRVYVSRFVLILPRISRIITKSLMAFENQLAKHPYH